MDAFEIKMHTIFRPATFRLSSYMRVGLGLGCEIELDPWCAGRCLSPSVGKLDTDLRALRMGKVDDALEGLDLGVGPQASIFGANATLGGDSCGLKSDAAGSSGSKALFIAENPINTSHAAA